MAEKEGSHLAAKAAMLAICLVLTSLVYVVSIGPVYYCWAAFSADMGAHSQIESFYSPLLEVAPLAREYRDASRIAGHHLTDLPLH